MSESIPAVFENGVFRPLRRPKGLVEHHHVTRAVDVEVGASRLSEIAGSLSADDAQELREIIDREFERGSGDRVALDTSVAIDVLTAKVDVPLLSSVNEHLLPAPVVGELRGGALNSRKPAENLATVEALITRWSSRALRSTRPSPRRPAPRP